MIAAIFLTLQIVLTPCSIAEVPGPVECGTYRVWENRVVKKGRQIDLSITVLKALSPNRQPDPLVFLQGGPGDAPSYNARFYSRVFANVRQNRDLVLIDLRGTGKSGALTCPELGRPDATGILDSEILGPNAVRACKERLEKNADLRQYTTEIAVDDLDEVREALGYRQINLYGTSYGTRVAQVYMRRHPASLRTVSLKAVVPPSMASPESHAAAGQLAWQELIKKCADDSSCSTAYPTLESDFQSVLKRLSTPTVLSLLSPVDGASKITVTRGLFGEAFRLFLYAPESVARAPGIVKSLSSESLTGLAEYALSARLLLSGERLAAGFFLSVSCTEDVPYVSKEAAAQAEKTFGGDYRLQQQLGACKIWPRGTVSAQHRALTKSDVPTLILSGDMDPVTPPAGGDEVLKFFKNGAHVIVRNNGHPIGSADKCISNIIGAMIEKGTVDNLDRSCAANVPVVPFVLPQTK
jgi:pimeloyl-ACP methyl ester carboxylesterase